jgi:hypothetical protein
MFVQIDSFHSITHLSIQTFFVHKKILIFKTLKKFKKRLDKLSESFHMCKCIIESNESICTSHIFFVLLNIVIRDRCFIIFLAERNKGVLSKIYSLPGISLINYFI